MKIIHKNSLEEFDTFPAYTKLNGVYGYLVLTISKQVFFISICGEGLIYDDLTDDFIITS